jgi:hypothetical protein
MSKEERARRYPANFTIMTDQTGGGRNVSKREILEALGYGRETVKKALRAPLTVKQIELMFGREAMVKADYRLSIDELDDSARSRTPQGSSTRTTRSQPPKANPPTAPVPSRAVDLRKNQQSSTNVERSPRGRSNVREQSDQRSGHRSMPYTDERQAARDKRRQQQAEEQDRRRGYSSSRQHAAGERATDEHVADNRRVEESGSRARDDYWRKDRSPSHERHNYNPTSLRSGPDSKYDYRYHHNLRGSWEIQRAPRSTNVEQSRQRSDEWQQGYSQSSSSSSAPTYGRQKPSWNWNREKHQWESDWR